MCSTALQSEEWEKIEISMDEDLARMTGRWIRKKRKKVMEMENVEASSEEYKPK